MLLVASTILAQTNRNAYWLHGLNGVNAHWLRYSSRFAGDRYMLSHFRGYDSEGSIESITNEITINPNPQNIGIGHSLGGIICRNFEATGGNELGGVITVHSPNKGATLATSVNNGSAEALLQEMSSTFLDALNGIKLHLTLEIQFIDDLVGGYLSYFNAMVIPTALFGLPSPLVSYSGIEGQIPSEEFVQSAITDAFDLLNDPGLTALMNDLDPTQGFMAGLNNFPSALPRIEVHGYEKDYEVLRMACSDEEAVWLELLTETTAYPDGCKKEEMEDIKNSLWWAKTALIAKATVTSINIINPRKARNYVDLWETVGEVQDARDLLDGDFEHAWEDLIGTQWEPFTFTIDEFSPSCQELINTMQANVDDYLAEHEQDPPGTPLPQQIVHMQNQIQTLATSPSCWTTVTATAFVPVDNSDAPNDGLILESEMTTGAANVVGTYQNKEVNHMEVLNHPEMWINFNDIFDSDTFFKTLPK